MDSQGRLYLPSLTALFDTIKLSTANCFVGDPEQFLNDLSKELWYPNNLKLHATNKEFSKKLAND